MNLEGRELSTVKVGSGSSGPLSPSSHGRTVLDVLGGW